MNSDGMLLYPCGGRVVGFIIIIIDDGHAAGDDTNGGAGNELSGVTEGFESPPISGLGIPPKALLLLVAPGVPFIIIVEPTWPIIILPVAFVVAISDSCCCGIVVPVAPLVHVRSKDPG